MFLCSSHVFCTSCEQRLRPADNISRFHKLTCSLPTKCSGRCALLSKHCCANAPAICYATPPPGLKLSSAAYRHVRVIPIESLHARFCYKHDVGRQLVSIFCASLCQSVPVSARTLLFLLSMSRLHSPCAAAERFKQMHIALQAQDPYTPRLLNDM